VRDWRRKYDYGVSRGEVQAFVAGNLCVEQFLAKYAVASRYNFSRYLCMFLKWLRVTDEDMVTLKVLLEKFKEGKVKISL